MAYNGFPYWTVPIFSAIVWLAMLLAMLVSWIVDGSPHYPSMTEHQTVAYISDVGAQRLKPLFIAMGAISVLSFDLAFILERWLRHRGRLTRNTSMAQRVCSILSLLGAIVGGAGLVLLAVFDTLRHTRLHNIFLALFIVGYIVSAIFTCAEYQRLGIHYREFRILRFSFWVKLIFILVSIGLAIPFGVLQRIDRFNDSAIIEWVIALVFSSYILSFAVDFLPANVARISRRETDLEKTTFTNSHSALPGRNF